MLFWSWLKLPVSVLWHESTTVFSVDLCKCLNVIFVCNFSIQLHESTVFLIIFKNRIWLPREIWLMGEDLGDSEHIDGKSSRQGPVWKWSINSQVFFSSSLINFLNTRSALQEQNFFKQLLGITYLETRDVMESSRSKTFREDCF